MIKKIIYVAVVVMILTSGSVLAATGIANTPHNLSASAPVWMYAANNEDQICIFCHTPHGGTLDAPLWNRDLTTLTGAGKFTHYSSAILIASGVASNRAVNAESLICLSCHDGSIGIGDTLINNSGTAPDNANVFVVKGGGYNPGPRIGSSRAKNAVLDTSTFDLSDDHPISVSYAAVKASSFGDDFQPVSSVEAKNLVLFGPNKNVECATCHDPHVDYINNPLYDPFLAIPNTGSDLCLSCHIK